MLFVFGEDDVARPVAAAHELCVAGDVGNDGLGRASGVEIAQVVRDSLDGGGIADVDVPGVFSRIEGDAEGVVKPSGELLNLSSLAVGAYATKHEQRAGARVGEEQVAVGRGADEARHGESATAERHVLFVVGALHGGGVAAGIERDFEAGRCDGPCVGGAGNYVGRIVDCLIGVGFGEVGERDLAANARLLLIPVSESGLTGDGLLCGCRGRKKGCGCNEGDESGESHVQVSHFHKIFDS